MTDFKLKTKERIRYIIADENGEELYGFDLNGVSPFSQITTGKLFKEFDQLAKQEIEPTLSRSQEDELDEDEQEELLREMEAEAMAEKGRKVIEFLDQILNEMIYEYHKHREFVVNMTDDVDTIYAFIESVARKWAGSISNKKKLKKKRKQERKNISHV